MLSLPHIILRKIDQREREISVPPIRLKAGQVGLVILSDDRARMALMRFIAGLPVASSLGWLVDGGQSVPPPESRSSVQFGLLYENSETQFSGLFNEVASELLLPLAVAGISREIQILSLSYQLAVWGLTAKKHTLLRELSDGQQQRLLMSSMLLANNDVVLSDSSLAYIDPINRARLLAFLKVHMLATGRAIALFTTAADKVSQDLIDIVVRAEERIPIISVPAAFNTPTSRVPRTEDRNNFASISIKSLEWSPSDASMTLYGGLTVMFDRGQAVLVTGSNGSGKSSLAYLLSGIETPSTGSISISGKSASHWHAVDTPRIRIAPADPDLVLGEIAVRDEIILSQKGILSVDDIHILKDVFGITALENVNPFSLSWHQRRHVAVLQALAGAELAVFLDEPTADSSDEDVALIARVIAFCALRGVLVICASNDSRLTGSSVFDVRILLPMPIEADASQLPEQIAVPSEHNSRSHSNHLDAVKKWQSAAKSWIANTGEFCLFWTRFVYPELTRLLSRKGFLPPIARLFDLGCGSGLHTRAVRNLLVQCGCCITKTVGIDFVESFIELAKVSCTDPNSETFLCADLTSFGTVGEVEGLAPSCNETAVVTAFFSLHDLSSLATLRVLLQRLRKSGAVFIAVIVSPDFVDQSIDRQDGQFQVSPDISPEGRDWDKQGLLCVSSDQTKNLTVPYFHRAIKQYVEMLEEHWGPVYLHTPNVSLKTTCGQAIAEGCRDDEIVFVASRVA
jgi:energy-coupling factor transporter ATP-binding protein EcfA2